MWRRAYLFLVVVRLYFALQPSYIHPDEHFQGPEVIAGEVFGWPSHKTWEFTSASPIRSVFPLFLAYGFPLTVLKWLWEGLGYGPVPPLAAFYTLRGLMFTLSFVFEDWAIHELVPQPKDRRLAITLVASSYVTWTFQTHTFSNSLETLLVLWCLVLMQRIRMDAESTKARSCSALAFLGVLGLFNRITFPAFLVIPAIQLAPHLFVRTLRIPILAVVVILTAIIAVTMDTEFYNGYRPGLRDLYSKPIITPLNNLLYNMDEANLATHGVHPFWQHILANLPQLIGPAFPLLLFPMDKSHLYWSGLSGAVLLSCFKHQEARFLLPAVPLLLASIRVPQGMVRAWTGFWIAFNLLAATVFGVYHQGGVIPAQTWLSQQTGIGNVFWWKTYSPPHWLVGESNFVLKTHDLMGMPCEQWYSVIKRTIDAEPHANSTLLVAPLNANRLDCPPSSGIASQLHFEQKWQTRHHVGLDDLDFGDDGVWPTLARVIGGRGLGIWEVSVMPAARSS